MYAVSVSLNDVTLVSLKSCVDIGAIYRGHEAHIAIMRKGFEGEFLYAIV